MNELSRSLAPYLDIALAIGLGLLLGIQRGWAARNAPAGSRVAGVRTFALIGLAGGVAGEMTSGAPTMAIIILASVAVIIILGYVAAMRRASSVSATSSIVGLLTLAIGFLATSGQSVLASVIAAVVTLILSLRTQLHGWLSRMNEVEMGAIARFALISLAILPLLPDRSYGPYDAWNPRQLWLVVVLVSGFSFLGYIASIRLGASRGTIATAATGALVSSTAVTASLATRLRDDSEQPGILIAGIAMASAVMFVRVLILVAALAPFALPSLSLLVVPAALTSGIATIWALRSIRPDAPASGAPIAVRNPFNLGPALGLAALVMVLSLVARWVLHRFGDAGLATVLAISGMVDVDSAIITMGGLPPGSLAGTTAGLILAAPIMLNTLFKAGVAVTIAGGRKGWPAALPLVASVVAGLFALPFLLVS